MTVFVITLILACVTCMCGSEGQRRETVPGKNIDPWSERSMMWPQARKDTYCKSHVCWKRAIRQEEMGPFWANRGKRYPTYKNNMLFVQEPHWILVRRDEESAVSDFDPFFITRGKKADNVDQNLNPRDRRELDSDYDEAPFFAVRGKKAERTV